MDKDEPVVFFVFKIKAGTDNFYVVVRRRPLVAVQPFFCAFCFCASSAAAAAAAATADLLRRLVIFLRKGSTTPRTPQECRSG